MFDPSKILVLAPHTDDGELGCGATIASFCSQGKNLEYVAFSTCQQSLPKGLAPDTLEKECRLAVSELGVKEANVQIFDFQVREFPAYRQPILETLVQLNKDLQPDLVIIPSASDVHQDHAIIHQESLRAFKNSSILGYELPWNQRAVSLNFFRKVSDEDLSKKIKAIGKYQSQSHRNYVGENFIRSLAAVRGVQCNAKYAEAFEVYRIVS